MGQVQEGFYFITDRTDHNGYLYTSSKIRVTEDVSVLDNYFNANAFGYDIETNGARFYTIDLLLISIGDRNTQIVIDATAPMFNRVKECINDRIAGKVIVGHNIKFDYTHSKTNGIHLDKGKMKDTMLAEQRINLGRTDTLNNLEDTYQRRLKEYMDTDKQIRKEFLKMNKRSKFNVYHVLYSGKDISGLLDIARAQRDVLRATGQWDWFDEVENGIVPDVGDAELEGIACYKPNWRVILDGRKKDMLLSERKLDEFLNKTELFKIKGRNRATVMIPNLFDSNVIELDNINKKHLNYGSTKQVLKAIKTLGYPAPILKEKGKAPRESASEKAIQPYLIQNPTTPLKPFLKEYLEFKGHQKFVTSYGLKFLYSEIRKKKKENEIGFVNPVTGKVHTSYKQCNTDTGRFSSGDVKSGYFQSQNLPRQKPVREAFGLLEEEIRDGWYITTSDLTGAELIIMAALANDQHLYELGADKIVDGVKVEGDLHSPIATKCWRAVWQMRNQIGRDFTIFDSENREYVLREDFVIDKNNNKPLRVDFKPMTFGTIYGLHAKKGGQTLNIPTDEAQVIIDVITKEFPLTFRMVEQAAQFALADGYVEFNSVSHNRRWFTEVIAAHERLKIKDRTERYWATKNELPFNVVSEIEGAARNCRIQGTQADMIKESKLRLRQHALKVNVPYKLLLTVHDELVVKHKSKEFGTDVAEIMTNTANRYLAAYSSNIRMKADYHTGHTWTK
jgi:DNA polymerase I-like protein with 3'-5' exonuclease and polymerase domains